MRKALLASMLFATLALAGPAADGEPSHGTAAGPERAAATFEADKRRIRGHLRDRVKGSSWHSGCPVSLRKLRLVRVSYWDFARESRRGSVIVHKEESNGIIRAMRSLFEERYPIRRMHLIDRYDADDHASMNADNTSAFNCRFVAGTSRWSMHAYGRAIDINPRENPYVTPSGHVSPPAGEPYAGRSRHAKGMIHHGDSTWDAFRDVGWKWGGDWSGTKDFQHFSSNGS